MLVAALGAPVEIAGYGLAGVVGYPAEDDDGVRSAWNALPDDIGLVILTRAAADVLFGLGTAPAPDAGRLVAVMPI